MIKDELQKQLDKKKFFIVRFALYINLLLLAVVIFLLCMLKIEGQSIFVLFLKYYFRQT